MTTKDTKSNARIHPNQQWGQDDSKCVHGLPTYAAADQLRQLTVGTLRKSNGDSDYRIKVRRYPLSTEPKSTDTFSMLVFRRIETLQRDSYTLTVSDESDSGVVALHAHLPKPSAKSRREGVAQRREERKNTRLKRKTGVMS